MAGGEVDFGEVWRTTLDTLDADGVPVTRRAFLSMARLVGLLEGEIVFDSRPEDVTAEQVEALYSHAASTPEED